MSLSSSVARVLSSSTAVKQNHLKRKRNDDITQDKAVHVAMHKDDDEREHTEPSPPSWGVLDVLGYYMEPETLCVASCVSTEWLNCFSSEDLWKYIMIARSAQPSSPYKFALENTENISYKHLVSTVERDAKRRRKDKPAELKISLSDLSFIVHVSTATKEASVLIKGKDLEFGPNDKFHIEADVSNSGIVVGEKDVRMTWQVVFKSSWANFSTLVDTTRSLDTSYGWFTDELQDKDNRKLVGDVKPSFNGDVLHKIGFAMMDSDGWGSLLVDGFLRYLQRFLLE
ncbi:unnamed protein product [Thlaspi arvense]|uniref:F-box protein n=1 Tax=Thlaspi arvense TaxID=13288 RepID=A0AAU9SYF1_THLAR|nr:unnamed protein product [Thlaspi arvense]